MNTVDAIGFQNSPIQSHFESRERHSMTLVMQLADGACARVV